VNQHDPEEGKMRTRKLLVSALAAGLLLVGAGLGALTYALASPSHSTTVVRAVAAPAGQPTANTSALTVNQIYTRDLPSVVEITVTENGGTSLTPFGGGERQQAQGSGFVYDTKGDIITNAHVVDGASSVHVSFSDGSTYGAKVVGGDNSTDLAVVRVDAPSSKLHPLTLADSGAVKVGDGVVAIGSPFGLEGTATAGIVSALHRQITSPNGFPIGDAIQTDAPINHGNSGGPLLDLRGDVIGVTSQIESDSGDNAGVGFAIPSNTVLRIANALISTGKVEHAYIGVGVTTIPASAASALGTKVGVAITSVKSGSPAAKAGLHAATGSKFVAGSSYPTGGDVVTAFDGARLTSTQQLEALVASKRPGDKVSLTVVRSGHERTVQLVLATRPS
jgi:S1-C subfamily serine protease